MTATDYEPDYDQPRPDNPVARPTRYTVTCLPDGTPDEDMWAINVETRPGGRWAVRHHAHAATLGRDGTWDVNGIPEIDREEWLAEHWSTFDEAMARAKLAAPNLVVSGMTPADLLAWHAAGCPLPIPRSHSRARTATTETPE